MRAVGLLFPRAPRPALAPEDLPLGRAALRLAEEGIAVILGDLAQDGVLHGERAVPGAWIPVRQRVLAAVDRFPGQSRPTAHQALLAGLGAIPIVNPPRVNGLLRDKLTCQAALHGLGMPELCVDPRQFASALEAWGAGFLKPRFGSFGRGVRFVRPGDPLPARDRTDGDQPMILQRAVPAPEGVGGVCLRVLVQREGPGWVASPAAARVHASDPVVNHARGAIVLPASDRFGMAAEDAARALAVRVAQRFPDAAEIGVDLVFDPALSPHVIEVNGQPRGRLAELAAFDPDRFGEAHLQALCRPFRAALPSG